MHRTLKKHIGNKQRLFTNRVSKLRAELTQILKPISQWIMLKLSPVAGLLSIISIATSAYGIYRLRTIAIMVTTILNQARSVKAIDKIMLTRKENTDQEITVNEDMHIYFTLAWLGGISFVIITIVFLAHLYFYMIRYFKIRQQKRKDGIYMLISSPRSHVMLRLVRGQFDPSTITFKNDLNDAEIQLVESIQNMAVINYRGYSMEVNLSQDVSRI